LRNTKDNSEENGMSIIAKFADTKELAMSVAAAYVGDENDTVLMVFECRPGAGRGTSAHLDRDDEGILTWKGCPTTNAVA
jgi:hypothetical protein